MKQMNVETKVIECTDESMLPSELRNLPSNITHDKDWLQTELAFCETLYDKVVKDLANDPEADFGIPSPFEYFQNSDMYDTFWSTYKEKLICEFKEKHADALAWEKEQKTKKLDKYSMSDEAYIEKYLQEEAEYTRGERRRLPEPGPEFEEDRKLLRSYLGSELCGYLAMLPKLNSILKTDFPNLKLHFITTEDPISDLQLKKLLNEPTSPRVE
jgi:hypothetical protein